MKRGIYGTIFRDSYHWGYVVDCVFEHYKLYSSEIPDGVPENLWLAIKTSNASNHGSLLGILERAISAMAAWTGVYDLVIAMLAFKVASKWEVWSTVLKLPDSIEGVDDITYLRVRRLWGANILMRFLIGSLLNVLLGIGAGFAGKALSVPVASIINTYL